MTGNSFWSVKSCRSFVSWESDIPLMCITCMNMSVYFHTLMLSMLHSLIFHSKGFKVSIASFYSHLSGNRLHVFWDNENLQYTWTSEYPKKTLLKSLFFNFQESLEKILPYDYLKQRSFTIFLAAKAMALQFIQIDSFQSLLKLSAD